MEIWDVFRQQTAFKDIEAELEENRLSHAYIVESKDGTSSFHFARLVAMRLNCSVSRACGKCPGCLKILGGTHPDVLLFPQEKERFVVADSRAIIENSMLAPMLSNYKIFILNNFENATEEAQNKILKLVEEPNSKTMFFICTKNTLGILPTIRSRCRQISLMPLPLSDVRGFVKNQNAVDFGEGWIGISSELASRRDFDDVCEGVCKIITGLRSSSKLIYYSKFLTSEKKDFLLRLKLLALFFEDLLYIKENRGSYAKMKSFSSKLADVKDDYSSSAIAKIAELITKARKEFESNVSKEVLAENLLLKILEVKYTCK